MGETRSVYGRRGKCVQVFGGENTKERYHLKGLGIVEVTY